MTDKELLELAAKAAGYTHIPSLEIACGVRTQGWFIKEADAEPIKEERWNPLLDDGDALRLAVKLRIEIQQPTHPDAIFASANGGSIHAELLGNDPYAATRRAIVRAAAHIGSCMK